MEKKKKINIALIEPPLSGHKLRGIGEYTKRLYTSLRGESLNVELINFDESKDNFDLLHYPYLDPFFLTLPLIKKKPTVVTVHDLIPIKFPKFFPPGIKGRLKWWVQSLSLRNSHAIITDSFASKEDIGKFTGIKGEKVTVIYLGVGREFKIIKSGLILRTLRSKLKLPKEFILHVGDVNYNKNILGMVRAFKIASDFYPSLSLLLVGNGFIKSSPQLDEVLSLINFLKINDKVYRLSHLKTEELVGVYNLAKVYLQPSFAEGFGLPVLEAMACGCPAVVSNSSSLPELVGDASLLVNPSDEKDIGSCILEIMQNTIKRKELIIKGLQRVKEFNWKKTACETIKVYQKVLNND